MRKLLVALASVSLLVGGLSIAAPASADAVTPPATAKHNAHVGVRAPKGMPPRTTPKVHPNVLTPCGTPCYRYASGKQTHAAADGVSISSTVQKPVVLSTDYHSLFELATVDTANDNTMELGWNVDPSVNGDSDPHLFTFLWVNGVPQCYNGCPSGGTPGAQYLDAAGCSPWCAGDNLSSFIGTAHTFQIRHYATGTAGWWMSVDGTFRGVWPDTSFSTGTVSTTSTFTQAFGEVALGNTPSETDMGDAVLASSTVGALAQSFTLINSTSSPSLVVSGTGSPFQTDRWNWVSLSATSFRYGGPGGNEDIAGCSGVGAQPSFGFGVAPYNGGFGTNCSFSNTSGGVPVTPVHNIGGDTARNVCIPNLGTSDGQTTTPIRVLVNTTYVKWRWFRDAACAGASLTTDYGQLNLPSTGGGWTALAHASLMRTSTINSH